MKKIFSCVLVVVMLAALFVVGASAAERSDYLNYDNYGEIAQVERKSVRLNGEKDEAYDAATPIMIATPCDEKSNASTASGIAYIVYDSQYFWVFVEVNDSTLKTQATDPLNSKYTEDSIEIILDWTNECLNIANKMPYQARLSHQGYISAKLGQSGDPLYGSVEDGGTAPVTWLNGVTQVRADGTGYNCEFRIEVPTDVDINERIAINFLINDWTEQGGTRYMISSATNKAGTNWDVEKFGYVTFHGVPYTADTTVLYVALAMVTALVVGLATVVSLKKKAR